MGQEQVKPKRVKTGGRVKGTPNRSTRLREQAKAGARVAAELGRGAGALLAPLGVMLRAMRGALMMGDTAAAMFAAMAAAPYVHAKPLPEASGAKAVEATELVHFFLPDNRRHE